MSAAQNTVVSRGSPHRLTSLAGLSAGLMMIAPEACSPAMFDPEVRARAMKAKAKALAGTAPSLMEDGEDDRGAVTVTVQVEECEDKDALYQVDGVAVVQLMGCLTESRWDCWPDPWCCADDVVEQLDLCVSTQEVRGVCLLVDSPGGCSTQIGPVQAAIERCKAAGIPVVCFIMGRALSAAYWLAACCDAIYGGTLAQVGSIGAYVVLTDYSEMYKAAGINVKAVASGPHKATGVMGTPITDDQLKPYEQLIGDMRVAFEELLTQNRPMSAEQASAAANGSVFLSTRGVDMGLMDGVEPLEDVLAELAKAPLRSTASTTTNDNQDGGAADNAGGVTVISTGA